MRAISTSLICFALALGSVAAQPAGAPVSEAMASGQAAGTPAVAPLPALTAKDWQLLQQWRIGSPPLPVPTGGVEIRKDTATWILESGNVSLFEGVASGRVTGLVFEGKGRFRMDIPDSFEVTQLRRFTGRPTIERIDEPFTRMVLRTCGPLPAAFAAGAPASYGVSKLAKERHEAWLQHTRLDADARVIAGLLTPGDDYLLVDVETADFGWLLYQWDPRDQEEVGLYKMQALNDFVEEWVSLDRPEERDAAGHPTSSRHDFIHISHVDIDVDLSKHDGSSASVNSPPARAKAFFRCRIAFQPLVDGPLALRLQLDPLAKVTAVRDAEGRSLEFLRDHIGARFAAIDNEVYDGSLVVLLDRPLRKGEERQLDFEYEMKIYNYVFGRDWYPGTGDVFGDRHTARLSFTLRDEKFEVRAVGTQESEKLEGERKKVVWVVNKPTGMVAFSFGRGFKEERIKIEGVPEVVSFGTTSGLFSGAMVRNVAVDVANSLNFFQQYFDVKIPAERIYATYIMGDHGQAFEGFLHLSKYTYDAEHPGQSELFRAHEVAHQIWGHMVAPKSYRDAWLSEGFAEYSAMLFIAATMPKERYYDEILDVYADEQLGSMHSSFSKFARPWDLVISPNDRRFVGPLAAGPRASSAVTPGAYLTQVYDKGALVLHMLRTLLLSVSRDHDVFREVMQDFIKQYAGKEASTADFQRVLSQHVKANWQAFFDAWVNDTVIPTYTWRWECANTAGADGKFDLAVNVKQSDVPEGFGTLVPLTVDFGGKSGTIYLPVGQPEKTFHIAVPSKPKAVVFNPHHGVLARMKT